MKPSLNVNLVNISEDVAKQFPDDLLFADLGVESYFGMPIVTSDGRKIGLIGAMSTSATFMDTDNVEILRIAAAQVGSELELSSKRATSRR